MWFAKKILLRKTIVETNKEKDYIIDLGNHNWGEVEFLISIKSMNIPYKLDTLEYDIEKLSFNRYRIKPIAKGWDFTGKLLTFQGYGCENHEDNPGFRKVIPSNKYGSLQPMIKLFGFRYTATKILDFSDAPSARPFWGFFENGTEVSTSYGLEGFFRDPLYSNFELSSNNVKNKYSGVEVKSGVIYLSKETYGQFCMWDINTDRSNHILNKVTIDPILYQDSLELDMSLIVLVVEKKQSDHVVSDSIYWKNSYLFHPKMSVVTIKKANNSILNFYDLSKKVRWKNPIIFCGANSIYKESNIGYYELKYHIDKENNSVIISNVSSDIPKPINKGEGNLNGYSISDCANVTVVFMYERMYQKLHTTCNLKIYNNNYVVGTLFNDPDINGATGSLVKNYIAKSVWTGRGVVLTYYFMLDIPKETMVGNRLNLKWGGSLPSGTIEARFKVIASTYEDMRPQSIQKTYNDIIVYAYEQGGE